MGDPDFYLASSDYYNLEKPRRIWSLKRIATPTRDDLLLVKVAPPITGERGGSPRQCFDTEPNWSPKWSPEPFVHAERLLP